MKKSNQAILWILVSVIAVFTGACSSKPFLVVQYQLPQQSKELAGKTVFLTFRDLRKTDSFLGPNATKSLNDFNGTFSLVIMRQNGAGELVGAYNMLPLLKEIFEQRLKYIGIETTEDSNTADAGLEVELQAFKLDLVDRKWVINMAYQANLIKDTKVLSMDTVSGSAERLKVMGKSDAEKIIGSLLSDMVNKLDLVRLFQQAGL